MKPEQNSRRLFGITRSKGKMYELGLPEELHIDVPANSEPQELFILTVGILGDVAAFLNEIDDVDEHLTPDMNDELGFAASFFDAFLESRFSENITSDVTLLAAAAYYLARRPGSSLVLAKRISEAADNHAVDKLLHWILQARWSEYPTITHPLFDDTLGQLAMLVAFHFYDGSGMSEINDELRKLRHDSYVGASSRELLFIDVISAIIKMRVATSAWTTLPGFTQIAAEHWAPVIRRADFPKELWPAQILIGRAGLFSGTSGIIQMPTSAGKTRSIEIILRSGFLSGRTKVAVVVAPFRALCHEIGTSLRHSFSEDNIKVNELTDALQLDFLHQVEELIGETIPSSNYVLVLTPEKFLFVLRQSPQLANDIGIVVYDEGHQFDTGSRGIVYELLLTEIKALLPENAQTILVSAVIQNAQAVGEWLIGDEAQVVNGTGLLPTARSVAFASWAERLGQLMFYESDSYAKYDYFVPRVIEQHKFERLPRQRVDRFFPEKNEPNDVSLYLGIRLASQGAVAIFCGLKATASGMAARAVEIYKRGFTHSPPATFANSDEIQRLKTLVDGHFGSTSITSRAVLLGIFVHHSNTPHGLRLSIEYAMQRGLINFVACTSTLAQGVNLPIRYLIVSGIYQAGEKIKVRDFQNLVGRAGRAGMHTEGLVIFSDPEAYDTHRFDPWKFNSSIQLLSPANSEHTTSTLLELLDSFSSLDGADLAIPVDHLCNLIFSDEQVWVSWADEVVRINPYYKFDAKLLVADIRRRRRLILAIESYLMANRGTDSPDEFRARAGQIASYTLAYHLASDDVKSALMVLFTSVAEYVLRQAPEPDMQVVYSKTLLGVKSAKEIEQWVNENRQFLLTLDSNDDWLAMTWSLFAEQLDDKFFHTVEPNNLPIQLANLWLQGAAYPILFEHSKEQNGTKPWGDKKRRKITEDEIIDFCETTLGFDCALILAAIAQFLFGENIMSDERAAALNLFQKALKYGMPDSLSISCYEYGFADRVVAQHIRDALRGEGFTGPFFAPAITLYRSQIVEIISHYPSYFESVLSK